MKTPIKLMVYALGLVVVFGGALGAGRLVGPRTAAPPSHADSHANSHADNHAGGAMPELPGGLQVAEDGYRLVPVTGALSTGTPQRFDLRVLGPDGAVLTQYTESHEKDLHLIVVRRDLSGFQHLHPTRQSDGTWSVPLAVAAPGQYRVFAD